MNTEYFIAKRIISAKNNTNKISKPIIKIASLGITLGIAVMIIAVSIVTGFKKEISDKVIGFGSHIQISKYDSNISFEQAPINKSEILYRNKSVVPQIEHIQIYATKAGIIKTNTNIEGILLKGIGSDFNWSFFNDKIIKGRKLKINTENKSNEILISETIAKKLNIKLNDRIVLYFFQNPPRQRKLKVVGIYNTGMPDFDDKIILGDIAHIQKLNNWTDEQIGGFEVFIKNFDELENTIGLVNDKISANLKAESIKNIYPQIFNWLDLQDINTQIIIILMVIVAGINMISALLILILEKANFIGILKSMGSNNQSIQKIFLYNATFIIGKGMLWGNIFGIGLCVIQYYFELIPLNPETYYLSTIPINLSLIHVILINVGTLISCLLMLLIPSMFISKISPIRSIKFN